MTTSTASPARAILDAPLPGFRRSDLRREPRKVRASEIRKLFRDMGLAGISVTAPNYANAKAVHVQTPTSGTDPRTRHDVNAKVRDIILAAFPDLDDRSGPQSDHFDYCVSVY
jgi:hypothetical protein